VKKIAVKLLALALAFSCGILPACSKQSAPAEKEDILVWTAGEVVEFTQAKCSEFLTANPELAEKFTVTVSAVSESEAAARMITGVEAGASIFTFTQDQLSRLVQADALSPLGGKYLSGVESGNDSGSVDASTMDGMMYAYPLTSDDGDILFYDKSVVTDPSSLDSILIQCKDAGKYFYMDNRNGRYLVSFFLGAGCHYTTKVNDRGQVGTVDCDFNSAAGLGAFKALIAMAENKGFRRSDKFADLFNPGGGQAGAAISGTRDAAAIKGYLGDKYGAAKLPTMTVGGQQVQMGAWGGYKLMGVNPALGAQVLAASHKLAVYLTGGDVQLARFVAKGWGPSNKSAQQDPAVAADQALASLREQLAYSQAQPQCSANFWTRMEAFGSDVDAGAFSNRTDEQLQQVLDDLVVYLKADVVS